MQQRFFYTSKTLAKQHFFLSAIIYNSSANGRTGRPQNKRLAEGESGRPQNKRAGSQSYNANTAAPDFNNPGGSRQVS